MKAILTAIVTMIILVLTIAWIFRDKVKPMEKKQKSDYHGADVLSLYLVYFQTIYQMRKYCNVKEVFFDKWCDNIRSVGLEEDEENEMIALACLAFKSPYKRRLFYSNLMLDFIHKLAKRFLKCHKPCTVVGNI